MNEELRRLAKEKNVRFWQIADKLHICEMTLTRMFRKPLSNEDATRIYNAINEVYKERYS